MIIVINEIPLPLKRPKICGKYFYDPQVKDKENFGFLVKSQLTKKSTIFTKPIEVQLEFHMPIPQSLSKKKQKELIGTFHVKKPDLSNLIKFVEDSLNGILWSDDRIICHLTSIKVYSNVPKTVIFVKEVSKEECIKNF